MKCQEIIKKTFHFEPMHFFLALPFVPNIRKMLYIPSLLKFLIRIPSVDDMSDFESTLKVNYIKH